MADNFPGITEKKMKNGSTHIMVRFKHLGTTYPVKNFTKLYGCETKSDAKTKLAEVKILLSQNINPFLKSLSTFADIYEEMLNRNELNKDWAYNTVKNRRNFFKCYIKNNNDIGRKKVENITYDDIDKFLKKFTDSSSSRNTAIDILRPVFQNAYDRGVIMKNIMKIDKFKKERYATRLEIESRVKNEVDEIIKRLYEAVELYDHTQALSRNVEIHKMYLYMILLTAHRSGEIIQLRKEHCDLELKKIFAPIEITKTEAYQYPIPEEVFEYIKNHKGGLLFPIPKGGTVDRIFRRLVKLADISFIAKNHNLSGHDTRRLMLKIMVNKLGIDALIADSCLEHKPRGVIKHYYSLGYKDKEKCFKKYWNFVRDGKFIEAIEETEENSLKKELIDTILTYSNNKDNALVKLSLESLSEDELKKKLTTYI